MGERGGTDGYAPSPVAVGVCVGSGKAYAHTRPAGPRQESGRLTAEYM